MERFPDGGRVMAKIIHHRYSARNTTHFHPALDAFEGVECGLDLLVFQAAVFRAGNDSQRVPHIQFANQVQM